jgi:hypothetical protein
MTEEKNNSSDEEHPDQKPTTGEKNNSSDEKDLDQSKFFELEYNTLRKEIETRADRHFKIAAGTLLIVPAVSILAKATEKSSGASTPPVGAETVPPPPLLPPLTLTLLMVLPMIVLALYALYVSEHHAIHRCARYIRAYIEGQIEPKPKGWETWLKDTMMKHEHLREHEKQQKIGLYLLYVPLYFIAAAEAAAVQWSEVPLLKDLPFSDNPWTGRSLAIAYLVAGFVVVVFVVKFPPKNEREEEIPSIDDKDERGEDKQEQGTGA